MSKRFAQEEVLKQRKISLTAAISLFGAKRYSLGSDPIVRA
jgi:hypothetical protein